MWSKRLDVFAYIAKTLVLNGYGVYYTNMHQLISALEFDAEKKRIVETVEHLFIEGVQKHFKNADKEICPYSKFQIMELEELLRYRRSKSRITHMSASLDWRSITWLSQDTNNLYEDALTSITLSSK